MKIRDIERLKIALLSVYASSRVFTLCDESIFKEVDELLLTNGISMGEITYYLSMMYSASLLSGFHFERFTSDYKMIKSLYFDVIGSIVDLTEKFGIHNDPVKIFALYVYLYRSGYLSVGKKFIYSNNMKDLSMLSGVDVIRGSGVCRSISSVFTDICNFSDIKASNVSVRVKSRVLKNSETLSSVPLKTSKNGEKLVKVVSSATTILPIGNHLVTAVTHDSQSGIYDPTNDLIMYANGIGRYSFINDCNSKMSYNFLSNFNTKLFGQMNTTVNFIDLKKMSLLPKISYEEYKKSYDEINVLIRDNKDIFEQFYYSNLPYYIEIDELTKNQHGLIKRVLPFIPDLSSYKK